MVLNHLCGQQKKTHIHWWQRGKCHHRCLHLRTLFTTWHTSHMYENKPVKGNYVAVCGRSCHIMFVLNAWQQRNYNTVLFILQIKLLLKEWNTKHKIDWHLTTTTHNKEASLNTVGNNCAQFWSRSSATYYCIGVHIILSEGCEIIQLKVSIVSLHNTFFQTLSYTRSSLIIPLRLCPLVGWGRYIRNI